MLLPDDPVGGPDGSGAKLSDGKLTDYTIEKAIGRGHFSVVHRAIRKSDSTRVALKKVRAIRNSEAVSPRPRSRVASRPSRCAHHIHPPPLRTPYLL